MKSRQWIKTFISKVKKNPDLREDGLRFDAGQTTMFQRQLEYFIRELFNVEYPEHKSKMFFPVDNSAPNGTTTVTHRQYDTAGRAKVIANYADDIPLVNVIGTEFPTQVVGLGAGYEISIQDLRAAAMAGVPLEAELADAARNAIELGIDEVAAVGDADAGLVGFLNHASIPLVAPDNAPWSGATPDEIVADIEKLWASIAVATNQIHMPDTLLLDPASWGHLNQRMTDTDVNIKKYLLANLENLKGLDQWYRLTDAGAASTTRIMAYQRTPRTGRIIIPQEFEQFSPQQRNYSYIVPCHARVGGAKIPYPFAFAHMDGTGA